MAGQTISITGGNHSAAIFGNGTIWAGDGSDTLYISGWGKVVAGNGADTVTIGLNDDPTHSSTIRAGNGNDVLTNQTNGIVNAGNGNDTLSLCENGTIVAGNGNSIASLYGVGKINIGHGNDTLTLKMGGLIHEHGKQGHDTINLGAGSDTVIVDGQATVWGAFGDKTFGGATINGGELQVVHGSGMAQDIAVSGKMTLAGAAGTPTEFEGGTGTTVMKGASGSDTFIGGSGNDTMIGAGHSNVFAFMSGESGGTHLIENFVSGDQLYVEGNSLSALQSANDITSSGGNTFISIDGGQTTIELKGVSSLSSSDVTTHKP
jgi:hypothetical protein